VHPGPRTIGFKLADECENLVARYGATSLSTNVWYHVAGVYNADMRTLDVYLNGKPDDGFLLGTVTADSAPPESPSTSANEVIRTASTLLA